MEVIAQSKSVRISPRKVRLVADSIKKKSAKDALNALFLIRKRGASVLWKTLKSAVANAVNNAKLKEENLFIKNIEITEGQALKRFHHSTRGRVHPYKKRGSHIRIVLEEKYGTKS
ncbi:MAG: 50S ribosomal protein L22 [Candidatus Levybacteria bacterium RIFCSPLOWO2_02_FULL_36_8b]|nr:MAG: 50S ribosomal protein L22 [Candidatus Levybacteria bacterium RIFCSPLOWO2_02_FULL_36_8b]